MTDKIREQIQDLRWKAEDYAYIGDDVMYTSWADTMEAMLGVVESARRLPYRDGINDTMAIIADIEAALDKMET